LLRVIEKSWLNIIVSSDILCFKCRSDVTFKKYILSFNTQPTEHQKFEGSGQVNGVAKKWILFCPSRLFWNWTRWTAHVNEKQC